MSAFVQEARRVYDIVILDSPPLVPVTDAAVLSALMDGIVLVIRVGKTSIDGLKRSLELLKPVGKRILGVVLTGIEKSGYYGYRHYYSTYAEIEENGKKEKAVIK
jgi:Mrp family chromosome partitioning ATPase